MRKITRNDIDLMERNTRTNMINCLSGFKSANLVGTQQQGMENLAVISSVVHIGANPPLLGMIMRPHTVPRDTLENIRTTGYYTINHVHQQWVDKAHQTSARDPREQSEFAATGLTPWYSADFAAPYVAESQLKIGLKVEEIVVLACNLTELVIGQVEEIWLPENALFEDGFIDLTSLASACISGLDGYHSTSPIARFSYAKPDAPLAQLDLTQAVDR
jgi:flavin reductase (DIM6/NTAB) family NADH-FMN oxidoreductase RutF